MNLWPPQACFMCMGPHKHVRTPHTSGNNNEDDAISQVPGNGYSQGFLHHKIFLTSMLAEEYLRASVSVF